MEAFVAGLVFGFAIAYAILLGRNQKLEDEIVEKDIMLRKMAGIIRKDRIKAQNERTEGMQWESKDLFKEF